MPLDDGSSGSLYSTYDPETAHRVYLELRVTVISILKMEIP
jgi:hypothetical protein